MTGRQTNVIDSNMQLLLVKDSFYNIRCLPFMKNRHTDSYIVQKRLDLLKYLRKVSTTVKNAIHMIIFYPIFGCRTTAKYDIVKNIFTSLNHSSFICMRFCLVTKFH